MTGKGGRIRCLTPEHPAGARGAEYSPDGRHLSFVDWHTGDLALRDADGVLDSGNPDASGAIVYSSTELSTAEHLVTLTVTDPADGMTTPNFTVTANGTNGSATIDPASGDWSYMPDPNTNGADSFTYTLTDANGDVSTATVNLTVD